MQTGSTQKLVIEDNEQDFEHIKKFLGVNQASPFTFKHSKSPSSGINILQDIGSIVLDLLDSPYPIAYPITNPNNVHWNL